MPRFAEIALCLSILHPFRVLLAIYTLDNLRYNCRFVYLLCQNHELLAPKNDETFYNSGLLAERILVMKVCIAWHKNLLKEMTKGLSATEKRINRKHQVLSTHITSNMKLMLILVLKFLDRQILSPFIFVAIKKGRGRVFPFAADRNDFQIDSRRT